MSQSHAHLEINSTKFCGLAKAVEIGRKFVTLEPNDQQNPV